MGIKNDNKGYMTILLLLLVLAAVLSISSGIFIYSVSQQRKLDSAIRSARAYYAAESGIEDAMHRLSNSITWTNSYNMLLPGASTTINISPEIGGARTITSIGDNSGRIRKLSVVYAMSSEGVGFHYGAQAGDGGVRIENGCSIDGNIYSNGPINGSGNHNITGTVIVAKDTGYIDGAIIGGNAYVDECINSTITGTLNANTNSGCTAAGGISVLAETIATSALPITQEMIDSWKAEAESGGVTAGDLNLDGGSVTTMGPRKIVGNLTMSVSAQLNVTGTIWVTGNISLTQGSVVQLASSYGTLSGMMIADGILDLRNTARAVGSGEEGSYLMLVSTNPGDPAISIDNTFQGDIIFALNGWIQVKNSTNIREITGYGIHIRNSAGLTYEVGMANAAFTQGPGGSWVVTSYREVY